MIKQSVVILFVRCFFDPIVSSFVIVDHFQLVLVMYLASRPFLEDLVRLRENIRDYFLI